MVVSGPPKKGRGPQKAPTPTAPAPAAGLGTDRPAETAGSGLLSTLEARRATAASEAAEEAARTSPVSGSVGPGGEGVPARRLLLDAAAALAVTGVLVLVVSVVLAPRPETGETGTTETAQPSAAVSPGASAVPSSSPGGSPAATAEPSVAPPAGGYAVGSACSDAPDCFLYVVRAGDTIAAIGSGLGVTRTGILALNPDLDPGETLTPGASVKVPTPATD